MSSFHPVLGLLAVAVCISYAEGAPLLAIQKEDIPANELHKTDLYQSDQSAQNYGQDLRSIDEDSLLAKADARGSGSGDINEDSRGSEAILESAEPSASSAESSSGSEGSEGKRPTEDDGSNLGSGVPTSESEEDCDDDENKVSTISTPSSVPEQSTFDSAITSSQTEEPTEENGTTKPDDECEGEDNGNGEGESTPGTPTSSTEPSGSESPGEGTEENEDCEETTSPKSPETTRPSRPTTTRRPTKKPGNDNSSGSFNDSDPEGVDFSDSNSLESTGKSTELSDQLTD